MSEENKVSELVPEIPLVIERSGDILSLRLREKASVIIEAFARPLSSKEIETFLQACEPELYKCIKNKCEDYVRIILGNNKSDAFVKYKSKVPIKGIDKRTMFYGLRQFAETYSTSQWLEISDPTLIKKSRTPQEEVVGTLNTEIANPDFNKISYDEKIAISMQREVFKSIKDASSCESWNKLMKKVSPKSQLWPELLCAINFIGMTYKSGVSHPNLLNELMMAYPTFNDSDISNEVRSILLREIIVWNDIQLSLVI